MTSITGLFKNTLFVIAALTFSTDLILKTSTASKSSLMNSWLSLKRIGKCFGIDNLPTEVYGDITKLDALTFVFNITSTVQVDLPPDLKNCPLELLVLTCADTNFLMSSCTQMVKIPLDNPCEYLRKPNTYYAHFFNNSINRPMCPIKRGTQRYENIKLGGGLLGLAPTILSGNFMVHVKGYDPKKKLVLCVEVQVIMKPKHKYRNRIVA